MLDLLLVNPGSLRSQFGAEVKKYIQDMLKKKIGRDYEKTD